MSIELTRTGYLGGCDRCGSWVPLRAKNPRQANTVLRKRGWSRFDYIATIRTFLWQCPVCNLKRTQ